MKDKDEFILGALVGALGLLFFEVLLAGLYGLTMFIINLFL